MKISLKFFLLCLACAALSAWAQSFTFDYPKGWKLEWVTDKKNKSAAPDAQFTSETDRIIAGVSILQGRDASGLNPDQLQDIIMAMAIDSVPKSLEGKANVVAFGNNSTGMYIRLTDKNSKSDYKYLTVAIHRNGKELALGQMTSNDDDGAMLGKFLDVVKSIVAGPAQVVRTSIGGTKSANKELWGAIATEPVTGDTDPYYGIGGGNSQAEAEENAQSFCREAGAKHCVVRVAYTQCGAYAVTTSGFGTGTGPTKKTAEKIALNACNGKNCNVVASDCN